MGDLGACQVVFTKPLATWLQFWSNLTLRQCLFHNYEEYQGGPEEKRGP